MRRTDDFELSEEDVAPIRRHAAALLRKAGAYDVFPTPTARLVHAAGLRVENTLFTDSDVLQRMESAPADRVKRARRDLVGVVDILGNTIYVHPGVSLVNLPPLVLHEAAHAYLDWQRDLYLYVQEDDAGCIASGLRDRFELEANRFAWELIFQGDRFQKDAEKCAFCLETPVKLAERYGTSVYAAARWFVETSARPCALLIYSRSTRGELRERRPVQSPSFLRRFGRLAWSDVVRRGGSSALMAGYGARYTVPLADLEKRTVECEVHSLTEGNHSFTLLYPRSVLSMISLPNASP